MQYEDPSFSRFTGENIDIGLNGGHYFYNPDFTPTYNYQDDHIYGYSSRSVAEEARERLSQQNGLNYDNLGRKYPGPNLPQDYSYFLQRNPLQGFIGNRDKSGFVSNRDKSGFISNRDKAGFADSEDMYKHPNPVDYAILISSNVHYFVLLLTVVLILIISVINAVVLIALWRKR